MFAAKLFRVDDITETTLNGIEALSSLPPAFSWPLSGAVIKVDGTVSASSSESAAHSPSTSVTSDVEGSGVIKLHPLHIRTFTVNVFVHGSLTPEEHLQVG